MTVVICEGARVKEFANHYEALFTNANNYAKKSFKESENREVYKEFQQRKTRYYQDYRVYQEKVREFLKDKLKDSKNKFGVDVYFE